MQTTLLGIGIAIILAIVAALVGPYFIDWSAHRSFFEARASRMVGMPVRIAGQIDARLLPIPSVTLRGVEARDTSGEVRLQAREVAVEFALGVLVRGGWRATEMRVVGADLEVGLDRDGRFAWNAAAPINPDALSIDRLSIEDGRVTLVDAASSARVALEDFWFKGEVRSLVGPAKGEGGFAAGSARHAYRLTAGKFGDDGVRLRLAVDPADRPLSVEADGMLRFENASPRFEGAFTLTRLAGVVMSRGRAVNSEPLRLTSRIKASPQGALLEQLELQYGPEERGLRLSGVADLKLGARPRLEGVISARQLDLDRLVALPEPLQRLPMFVLRTAVDALGDTVLPAIPVRLGVGVDSLMIGGASVQGVRGDVVAKPDGWDIETLEFRAPGFAHVRASGRVTMGVQGASFAGPASIEATDPTALLAWLEGSSRSGAAQVGPLRAAGEITLAADRIAVERLKAEIDRKAITGRFVYAWTADGAPPHLEAALSAAAFDLDAAARLLRAALPGSRLDLPATLALDLDIGHATFAGVEARETKAKLKLDAEGLVFERLTIGDLAGAAIDLKGNIKGPWAAPRGSVTFGLSGHGLDGIVALIGKVSPRAADVLRPLAPQLAPAKLRIALAVAPAAGGATATIAKARIDGSAGALRVAATGDLTGDFARWKSAALNLDLLLAADDGWALARLGKLDGAVAVRPGAGSLRVTAAGPLDGEMKVSARLSAGGVEIAGAGSATLNEMGVGATIHVFGNAADVTALHQATGSRSRAVPVALEGRILIAEHRVHFENLTGTIAGSLIYGGLTVTPGRPLHVDGRLDIDTIDGPALMGALLGVPPSAASSAQVALWPAQAFADRLLAGVEGRVVLRANRAVMAPAPEIRQFEALIRLAPNETAIEDVKGVMAGGQVRATLTFPRGSEGTAVDAQVALTGADIAALLPGEARAPVRGRVSLQVEAKGRGRSAAALVSALNGAGAVSFEGVELVGLDPRVFETVIRAVDKGLSVDVSRIQPLVERALGHGRLRIVRADGTLALTAGQLRLAGMLAKAEAAELSVNASVDLAQGHIDTRLAIAGESDADGPAAGRPEVFVAFKGPLAGAERVVDASALVGWLTLRAVDLQARKLQALEAERAAAAQAARAPPAAPPPPRSEPAPPPAAAKSELQAMPASAPTAAAPAPPPQTQFPPVVAPEATAPRSGTASGSMATPSATPQMAVPDVLVPPVPPAARKLRPAPPPAATEQAPALPPPIDIRPAPTIRRPNAQRHDPPRSADARPPDARPARNLLDLFGAR